jgi:hypothetical protein
MDFGCLFYGINVDDVWLNKIQSGGEMVSAKQKIVTNAGSNPVLTTN